MCIQSGQSISSPSSPLTFIRLPLEIQREIISYLDCFSIRSFLEAFPLFKKHTLHIHGSSPSKFFSTTGIDHVHFSEVPTWTALISRKRGYLIKLYDINTSSTEMELLASHHKDLLDQLSFIHINDGALLLDDYFSKQKYHFLGSNGSKIMESWDGRSETEQLECLHQMSFNPILLQPGALVSLNVEVWDDFGGADFSSLKELRVHFQLPCRHGRTSSFHGVKAPSLGFLRVYFEGDVPLFTGVDVASHVFRDGGVTQFELCDTKAFDYKKPPYVNHTFDLKAQWDESELDFTKNFKRIALVGVHEGFIMKANFASCVTLQVLVTVLFKHPNSKDPPPFFGPLDRDLAYHIFPLFPWWNTDGFIRCVCLESLTWKTNLDDSRIVELLMRPCFQKCSLTLYITGKRFYFCPFLRRNIIHDLGSAAKCQRLTIINDLRIKSRSGANDHMALLHNDLNCISVTPNLRFLTIDGCYFGEFNEWHDVAFSVLHRLSCPAMKELRLNLVRRQHDLPEGREMNCSDLIISTFKGVGARANLDILRITQFIEEKDYKPWKSIDIIFPTESQVRGFNITTDGSFDEFKLNGTVLEQPVPRHILIQDGYWHERKHTWTLLEDGAANFEDISDK